MFKRLSFLFVGLALTAACSARPAEGAAPSYTDGVEYASIATPKRLSPNGKVEVVEVFSFGCIHCAHYEPKAEALQKELPKNVTFHRIAAATNDAWLPSAQAYYAAKKLGVPEKSVGELFDAKWNQHMPLNALEEMADWYKQHYGIDTAKFMATAQGPEVKNQILADTKLIQAWGIEGTPTIVVDGKYRSKDIKDFDQLNDVAKYLVDRELKGDSK